MVDYNRKRNYATAYGIMWNGVRDFCGRPTSVLLMLAGAVIWVLACQVEAFFTAPYARAALMSAIVVAYSVLSAWGFWRVRDEALMSRLPIIILLLAHAVIVVIRVPLAGSLSLPIASREIHVGWWTFIIFEAVFFSFCVAHLLGGIATEQIVLWYKHASLIDPLTGVGNRRAILERGDKLLSRTVVDRRCAVLLLFDLDKFKSINDTFGHLAGDRILITFCEVATAVLRTNDLFGRLGGEEFVALLPGTSLDCGLDVAERIRAEFEATMLDSGANTLAATVSVGVAVSTDQDLAAMIMAADRALYRAKANERNRIEYARPGSSVVQAESVKATRHRMVG